jgi:hypothetical protein
LKPLWVPGAFQLWVRGSQRVLRPPAVDRFPQWSDGVEAQHAWRVVVWGSGGG